MKNKTVVLLYNRISEQPKDDELDVIRQARFISKALHQLGYSTTELAFDLDIAGIAEKLKALKPLAAFNLVETVDGTGQLLHFSPSLLNHLGIPFTGAPLEALFITTNKILTKKMLNLMNIPTSKWYPLDEVNKLDPKETYIIKPISEDGSLGIEEDCVFRGNNKAFLKKIGGLKKDELFIEQFIDGREFNLSLLGGKKGPQVMPPAEILFKDYPKGKPKIVGFNAKWTEDSFEYNHTPRTFRYKKQDQPLLEELKSIALRCWKAFELRGYVRVDFRVDRTGTPYVLEINGNPCIAPESGYVAATKQAGLKFHQVVERIMEDALK
jgi:D-alanine-D-alanine ligase